ncbi:MAG: hypothetical protein AAFX78_05080 [Cyanobacteria bacterium J06638_20]
MVLDASQELQRLLDQNNLQYLCDRQPPPPAHYYGGIQDGGHVVTDQSGTILPAGRMIGDGAPAVGDPVLRVSEGGVVRTLGRQAPARRSRRRGRIYSTPVLWFGDTFQGTLLETTGDFRLRFRSAPVATSGLDFNGQPIEYVNATYATQRSFTAPQQITVDATITPNGLGVYPQLFISVLPWVRSPSQPTYTSMEALRTAARSHYDALPPDQRNILYADRVESRDNFVPQYIGLNSGFFIFGDLFPGLIEGFGYQGGDFGLSIFPLGELLAGGDTIDGILETGQALSASRTLNVSSPGDYLIVLLILGELSTGAASGAADFTGDGIYDVGVAIAPL